MQRTSGACKPPHPQYGLTELLVLLLVSTVCCGAKAAQGSSSRSSRSLQRWRPPPPVNVTHTRIPFNATGWEEGESEIADLIRDNLEPDLAPYRRKTPLTTADIYTLRNTTQHYYGDSTSMLVLIHEGKLYQVPWPGDKGLVWHGVDKVVWVAIQALALAMAKQGLPLPSSLFVINGDDNSGRICRPARAALCPAPLFSFIKGGEAEGPPEEWDLDLLVPQFQVVPHAMHSLPWLLKTNAALFRGQGHCGIQKWIACQRLFLADLSLNHGYKDVLDVGLTHGYRKGESGGVHAHIPDLPRAPLVSIGQHAWWRYLLALDGITASYRLDALLVVDSVLLKADSLFMAFYHRSIKSNVHYIPIWRNGTHDVLQVLDVLMQQDREQPKYNHYADMVTRATDFGHRYMHLRPRLLYWRAALLRYNALFASGEMEKAVQEAYSRVKDNPELLLVPHVPD